VATKRAVDHSVGSSRGQIADQGPLEDENKTSYGKGAMRGEDAPHGSAPIELLARDPLLQGCLQLLPRQAIAAPAPPPPKGAGCPPPARLCPSQALAARQPSPAPPVSNATIQKGDSAEM
jgi:hypothetical protein